MHGVVDPIAGAEIPEDAADVSEEETLQRRGGVEFLGGVDLKGEWRAGAKQSDQERGDGNPAKEIKARQRENEDLKDGGKDHKLPGRFMNAEHTRG